MKSLFIMSLFVILTSCQSEKSSQECFHNGEQVACSESSSSASLSTGGVELKVSTSTAIDIHESSIEMLENTQDYKSDTVNGVYIECQTMTEAGKSFNYKINSNSLTIYGDNFQEVYTKTKGANNSLEGSWRIRTEDEGGYNITNIEFKNNRLNINHTCYFY